MGYATNQAYYLTLIARNTDLQFQITQVAQKLGGMLQLTPSTCNSPTLREQMSHMERQLQVTKTTLQVQQKQVETTIDSIQKVIQKDIETSFKTLSS